MNTHWTIESIHRQEQTVHLIHRETAIRREFSIPGALHAWMKDDLLWVETSHGYLWCVTPLTGHRRRQRLSLADYQDSLGSLSGSAVL